MSILKSTWERWRFTLVAGAVVAAELVLGAWPVVATALWGHRAADTWPHFLWWVRAIFLFAAVVQNRRAPWRLGAKEPGLLQVCVGVTASCEYSTWILLSVIAHAMLAAILLLVVGVLRYEFASQTHWALSVAFSATALFESIVGPLAITTAGLGNTYGPLGWRNPSAERAHRIRGVRFAVENPFAPGRGGPPPRR